jgi:hypothetical protein
MWQKTTVFILILQIAFLAFLITAGVYMMKDGEFVPILYIPAFIGLGAGLISIATQLTDAEYSGHVIFGFSIIQFMSAFVFMLIKTIRLRDAKYEFMAALNTHRYFYHITGYVMFFPLILGFLSYTSRNKCLDSKEVRAKLEECTAKISKLKKSNEECAGKLKKSDDLLDFAAEQIKIE